MHTFHPFELAICGFSGSGKTTLLKKVVSVLSSRFSIAYYKHGCHRFDIDREGKDSEVMATAGARNVMISDPDKHAVICRGQPGRLWTGFTLQQHDILLVEGLKELPLPKILLVDRDESITGLVERNEIQEVRALVVADNEKVEPYRRFGLPVFQRDDIEAITRFIEELFARQAADKPVFGLVLAGGESRRMGENKALIRYHDTGQLAHAASMLLPYCRQVFISCRPEQRSSYTQYGFPLIVDTYSGIGPLAGLLSAQQLYPQHPWMLIACDMPFLTAKTTEQLAAGRNPFAQATAFLHPESGEPEPLCAVYEPKSRLQLMLRHACNRNSLKEFLQQSPVRYLTVDDPEALSNVNNQEEKTSVLRRLAKNRQ
ncbi:MAG TPA: bifunctional molybdenum cofactor guanylyltransferase MobA/molybdopterin-guanine dinucleotide biosynthesis adaptor protein MobB [Prosthecochloris aestuarii]|uniref:Probable molybdenum cofactor guanylyltransferase n=1 Tax=Prosthecochloris aestuarii TaxID=1102 RepID=A0A831STW2_PROAE|nr:bifunctional molybdenum cofactor guanylyltransferase MobA/molybdopterin-guanine dinucleotide biosynthesis adaptor protein MobB [Prosthecochloris sp.]HED31969.1 bifunctional molybdenum cofactor guanylyltransferase MobA/molybdopterin-guanine dinucleotide biosynthesis adaptor protein MobB [Prosthecochloris aestuarii]